MSQTTSPDIAAAARTPEFRQYLTDLLVETCKLDTSIRADVDALRENEHKVFDILERELAAYDLPDASFERKAIDPAIKDHPFFSNLYYTQTEDRPKGLSAEETYKDRANLILTIAGDGGKSGGVNQAINAHVDVVAPYFPPRIDGDKVWGRGACDDKGVAVGMLGAIKLIAAHLKSTGSKLNRNLVGMFVIEEEMGGNGSLSAAIDPEIKSKYDSLVVGEICENVLFPGNRGCVWYKVESSQPGVNLFEAAAYVIEQLEKEGRSIRQESDHKLFPHRPVQTCHGIIGTNGEHPSRINGDVTFDLEFTGGKPADARKLIDDAIQWAMDEYLGVYGDKTKVVDKATGKPKVDHHFDITETDDGFSIRVFGSTGHMGSIFENDGAITKMMTMVRSLIRSRNALKRASGASDVQAFLNGWEKPSKLLLEGGQGFLPTHEMEDVMGRMTAAVQNGAAAYFRANNVDGDPAAFKVSFEKLHNAAFAGRPDSTEMKNAIECAKQAGMWKEGPIRGWDVSCDARIFAVTYPDMEVITTGPGSLNFAHSDHEHIEIDDMVKFAEFLAYYILKQTGTA